MTGITTHAAEAYVALHGYNEIPERRVSVFSKIAKRALSPISLMLLGASFLSYANGKLFDCAFIVFLLFANIAITLWQERKADTAIRKLNENFATEVKTLRDGSWRRIASRLLAPHDVIELRSGDIVPADASVLSATKLSVNEAALTGESLPVEKNEGATLYSGSFIDSGVTVAEVIATGASTFFGKAIAKVDSRAKRSSLERNILRISAVLSALSLVAVVLLTWLLLKTHAPFFEILRLDLSLVIAGIPISLPTVMTLIIAFGVIALSKRGVVVRRLSSLEELADTDYLLTDKTGTLTQNKITIDEIISYGAFSKEEASSLACLVAQEEPDSSINEAILGGNASPTAHAHVYIPADSNRKRSTATFVPEDGSPFTLSLGAPQVIADLCALSIQERKEFFEDVNRFASRGYRALALARSGSESESGMSLVGLFSLSDALRADAGEVMRFLSENGVGVSMVTGDNRAIAREIAEKLAIPGGRILTPQDKPERGWAALPEAAFSETRAFAEILPEDKYELVRSAKRFYTVAANGDGVNDLPAVKEASVGFAVKNAVDALKAAADIVLISDGIGVMKEAFIEGRKIFMRLYSYSLYRISESFRLIVTIAILGFLFGTYPLSPLQLILIALLNDIPIISLAANRVELARKPSKLNVREQFTVSILFGMVGVVNSLLLYFLALHYFALPLAVVQTMFFLKLTVSGHLLIYVAHTKRRWWKYLPSAAVIIATLATQLIATALAATGALMPAPLPLGLIAFVWVWSFFFMQVGELVKVARDSLSARLAA